MSRIYFIRHGQASYLSDNYDKLSEKGEEQAKALGVYFKRQGINFNKLYVGPLERQKRTQEIATHFNNPTSSLSVNSLEELREHDGPAALKIAYQELVNTNEMIKKWDAEIEQNPDLRRKNSLKIFEHFIVQWMTEEFTVDHPKVQPWPAFRLSAAKAIDTILENTEKGDTVAAYTSGGTISAIVAQAMGVENQAKVAEMNFIVRNSSITQFEYSRGKFNLYSFNEVPHLPKELITYV